MPIVPFIKALWPVPGCLNLTTYIQGNSDYEILCLVLQKLNEVVSSFNSLDEAVTELSSKFDTLEDFVNNYFDNLDVQDEINNKLDSMLNDGTLDEVLSRVLYGSVSLKSLPVASDYGPAISALLSNGVSVYIPNGVFPILTPITPTSNTEVYGQGTLQVNGNVAFQPSGTLDNFRISGITITDAGEAPTGRGFYNGSGPSISNITIENCIFKNLGVGVSFNADLGGSATNCTVKNCKFYNIIGSDIGFGYGVHEANATNVIVDNCYFYNTERHAIYFAKGDNAGCISNCTFEKHRMNVANGSYRFAVNVPRTGNVTMSNLHFIDCKGGCINIGCDNSQNLFSHDVIIDGVIIDNESTVDANRHIAIGEQTTGNVSPNNITIRNVNIISNNTSPFVFWKGKNVLVDRVVFHNAGTTTVPMLIINEIQSDVTTAQVIKFLNCDITGLASAISISSQLITRFYIQANSTTPYSGTGAGTNILELNGNAPRVFNDGNTITPWYNESVCLINEPVNITAIKPSAYFSVLRIYTGNNASGTIVNSSNLVTLTGDNITISPAMCYTFTQVSTTIWKQV